MKKTVLGGFSSNLSLRRDETQLPAAPPFGIKGMTPWGGAEGINLWERWGARGRGGGGECEWTSRVTATCTITRKALRNKPRRRHGFSLRKAAMSLSIPSGIHGYPPADSRRPPRETHTSSPPSPIWLRCSFRFAPPLLCSHELMRQLRLLFFPPSALRSRETPSARGSRAGRDRGAASVPASTRTNAEQHDGRRC